MTNLDIEIIKRLSELRKAFGVDTIKLSTEDEGLSDSILISFTMLAYKAGLQVTIKIGGCEAKSDIRKAGTLGVDKIISPMIQSEYDVKKFVGSINSILPNQEELKLGINIETAIGVGNLQKSMLCPEMKSISSIVVGRTDLSQSMNLEPKQHNSDIILKIIQHVSNIAKAHNKELFVGGGMSVDSIEFLKQVPYLSGFETRNIVFNSASLALENISDGIRLAHELELLLLEKKTEFYGHMANEDELRKASISKMLV